jgi:hypothetical protein
LENGVCIELFYNKEFLNKLIVPRDLEPLEEYKKLLDIPLYRSKKNNTICFKPEINK